MATPFSFRRYLLNKYLAAAKKYPIVWHETTPRCFECVPGCMCCSNPYYLRSEVGELSEETKNHLRIILLLDIYTKKEISRIAPQPFVTNDPKADGTCCFYKKSLWGYHCGVHGQEPLRCQRYPYYPVVDMKAKEVVILAEPFLPWSSMSSDHHRCFGLGKGSDVTSTMSEVCRRFLIALAEDEEENYLRRQAFKKDRYEIEGMLSEERIDCYTKPRYKTYEDYFRSEILSKTMGRRRR